MIEAPLRRLTDLVWDYVVPHWKGLFINRVKSPLPWEPQATLNPGAPRGALGESGPKKGKSQNACWGAEGPQESNGFKMVEDAPEGISRDPQGSWPRAAPRGANASEAVLDQFGGSGLESVQALWGSTLAHPPLFPF